MGSTTDFVFFVLIYKWLGDKIDVFGQQMMGNFMAWAAAVALVLVTVWILITGYRVLTGQMREPLMGVVVNMARIALIVTVATSMTFGSTYLYNFFTKDLGQQINLLVTGSDATIAEEIDKNLALTEVAVSVINAVQVVPGDTQAAQQQSWDQKLVLFGNSGPAIMGAVMLLMYQFALALFIGLGPLFILCLIFDQTKELFRKWLMYGIGTLFSLAVLNVVTSMVMELMAMVAVKVWTVTLLTKAFTGKVEGLDQLSWQQGGIGLILTMLIMTIPPMAAVFFNGTMGNFMYYSAFGMGAASRSAAMKNGLPPGAFAYGYDTPPVGRQTSPGQALFPTGRNLTPAAAGADEIRRRV